MSKQSRLSVIIIAVNEADDIRDCILSVKGIAEEVIVFDSGSTDGTPEICRELGAIVVETDDWPGDGPQKNRALDKAQYEWVLCLDADEQLSPGLREEISEVLKNGTPHTAFRMPRRNFFCGKFMKHSDWWPDYIVRFFRRTEGRFTDVFNHTRVEFSGSRGTFKSPIIHRAILKLEESLEKMNRYSTIGAQSLIDKGRNSSVVNALFRSFWMFFRTYILKLGIFDGKEGFILSVLTAEGTYYKYIKATMKKDFSLTAREQKVDYR